MALWASWRMRAMTYNARKFPSHRGGDCHINCSQTVVFAKKGRFVVIAAGGAAVDWCRLRDHGDSAAQTLDRAAGGRIEAALRLDRGA